MRAILLALVLLSGCDRANSNSQKTTVLPDAGGSDNFTAGGFPRHTYPIQNCSFELKLEPPFEVSEDGWGNPAIRIPLALLDDPTMKGIAEGGVDAQSRVSYAFPSLYRGEGMKEWMTTSKVPLEHPRSLDSAKTTLGTNETLKRDGTRGDTRYLGKLPDGREMALRCTATDWPNPTCQAELPIGNNGQRYLIIFPPKVIGNLTRMVEIGDVLFSDATAHCKSH